MSDWRALNAEVGLCRTECEVNESFIGIFVVTCSIGHRNSLTEPIEDDQLSNWSLEIFNCGGCKPRSGLRDLIGDLITASVIAIGLYSLVFVDRVVDATIFDSCGLSSFVFVYRISFSRFPPGIFCACLYVVLVKSLYVVVQQTDLNIHVVYYLINNCFHLFRSTWTSFSDTIDCWIHFYQ